MIKRFAYCMLFLCFTLNAAAQNNDRVTLEGKLVNFSNQVEVEDLSEFQYLLPPSADRLIIPDTAGNFSISFKLSSPNYFRIGRNILYLTPGDNMKVMIDKNKYLTSTFEGKGSDANRYLRNTPFPKGGSYIKVKSDFAETMDSVKVAAGRRELELKNITGVSQEFRRLEKGRITADIINSIRAGISYAGSTLKLKGEELKAYTDKYKIYTDPIKKKYATGFVDASLLKLVVYRDVCEYVLTVNSESKDSKKIRDWLMASDMVGDLQKLNDKKQIAVYADKMEVIKTPEYKNAVRLQYDRLMKFGKGDQVVDFTAVDKSGNKVSLSNLKGKVIYVDIWATWCGPCMAEMPSYNKLRDSLVGNKDIVFVSLSIDDGDVVWKNSLDAREESATGYQWRINRNSLKAYNIVGIPRSLVIDKDFKIVEMNGPLPSSKQLPMQLVALAGNK